MAAARLVLGTQVRLRAAKFLEPELKLKYLGWS